MLDNVLIAKARAGVPQCLVGMELTAADISVVCALQQLFTSTIKGADRYLALKQWLLGCLSQPEFVAVFGPVGVLVPTQLPKGAVGGTANAGASGEALEYMRYPIKIAAFDTKLPDLTFQYPIKLKLWKGSKRGQALGGYPI